MARARLLTDEQFPSYIFKMDETLGDIREELIRARKKFPPLQSPHEAYGVIAEEFNKEFLDAMHANDLPQMKRELIQVAAMALSAAIDLTET